jgi:hypothetical protein
MAESETKLARLTTWVREHMSRERTFLKSDLYAFARENDIERSALDFIYRCRRKGTVRDKNRHMEVLVPKGKTLEQFYKGLLKIRDKPVLQGKPKPPVRKKKESGEERKKEPQKDKVKAPAQPVRGTEPPGEKTSTRPVQVREPSDEVAPGLINAIVQRLEDKFKRIDDTVASINTLVEDRIDDLEKKVSVVIVKELEKRIHQLETRLEEFRAKAEAFDLIKRDVWELVQALEIVEAEREDVKKVLKKFL